jgi:hypothetical protein
MIRHSELGALLARIGMESSNDYGPRDDGHIISVLEFAVRTPLLFCAGANPGAAFHAEKISNL